jgi:hypothetical protein
VKECLVDVSHRLAVRARAVIDGSSPMVNALFE